VLTLGGHSHSQKSPPSRPILLVRHYFVTRSQRLGRAAALSLIASVAVGCSSEVAERAAWRGAGGAGATSGAAGTSAGRGVPDPGFGFAGMGSTGLGGFPALAGAPSASGGSGSTLPEGECATGTADTRPVTPTIWLVVDGSSSMTQAFGTSDRWQTLRSTLMDPGGVVESLQSVAKFGMVIYSGGARGGAATADCVQLVTVPPALQNHAAILAQYPMQPIGSGTPTDKALDHVVTTLPISNQAMLDTASDPIYVVLATDGQPNDMCGGGFGGLGANPVEQRVVDVTTKGTLNGMLMYVISLAGDDAALQTHLGQVAAATASKTPPFTPSTQQDLIATFRDIVGTASCQIDLKGKVEAGKECSGNVTLNGQQLTCSSDDGWRLVDDNTFTLTGTACTSFTSKQSSVQASFPCDVFIPE